MYQLHVDGHKMTLRFRNVIIKTSVFIKELTLKQYALYWNISIFFKQMND
jgi:hypothetical protein